MCTYCVISDWANRWVPPPYSPTWTPSPIDPYPFTAEPTPTPVPWTRQMVTEFEDLINRVKKLEEDAAAKDSIPPCFNDPKKLDFLEQIKQQLDRIEKKADAT